MPATTQQVDDARALVQARADAEGSNGAKYTFGSIDSIIDLGERIGKITGGQSWQSGGGVGPMEMLLRGLLDSVIDVMLRDVEPVGTIKMFHAHPSTIPSGWAICDGGSGTPDLRDKFILGGVTPGETGGSDTTSGSSTNNSGAPSSTQNVDTTGADTLVASNVHTHNIAHTHTHTPPFYRMVFIMKIAPP